MPFRTAGRSGHLTELSILQVAVGYIVLRRVRKIEDFPLGTAPTNRSVMGKFLNRLRFA